MSETQKHIQEIWNTIPEGVKLVCVSKFQPIEKIQDAYDLGERDFAESRVQELTQKAQILPKDIRWHFIGHLQTNKIRQLLPYVSIIQSVDSIRLLKLISDEAAKIGKKIDVLLEIHVAKEESKTGFNIDEILQQKPELDAIEACRNVHIAGVMSMATNTDDEAEIRRCFRQVKQLSEQLFPAEKHTIIRSYGMSDDYLLAISEGSNMVRIGSAIFGERG